MRNYRATNVRAYIASAPKAARPTLRDIRKVITSTIPDADEGISWGVPFYKHHGLLAGFSVFTNHASFGFAATLPKKEREALEQRGYRTGSKTVQIRFDQKVPTAAIRRILKAQAKKNEARSRLLKK